MSCRPSSRTLAPSSPDCGVDSAWPTSAAGDEVLVAIGSLLLRSLRPGGAAGRYGGDELSFLALDMPAAAAAARLDALRAAWVTERPPAASTVGFSVGIASVDGRGARAALAAADRALYRVKGSGGNGSATAIVDDDGGCDA